MKSKILNLLIGIIIGARSIYLFNMFNTSAKFVFEELPEPYYNVLFENDDVRIVEHKLNPREIESMHNHPPMYACFLVDAEVIVKGSDGIPKKERLKKCLTLNLPALTLPLRIKVTQHYIQFLLNSGIKGIIIYE